jgi:hypothetical protein
MVKDEPEIEPLAVVVVKHVPERFETVTETVLPVQNNPVPQAVLAGKVIELAVEPFDHE